MGDPIRNPSSEKAPNVPLPDQISPPAASTTQDHGRGSDPKITDTGTRTGGSPTASTHAERGAKPPLNRTWHFIRLLPLSLRKLVLSYLQWEVVIEWIVYQPMYVVFGGGEGSEAMLGCLECACNRLRLKVYKDGSVHGLGWDIICSQDQDSNKLIASISSSIESSKTDCLNTT